MRERTGFSGHQGQRPGYVLTAQSKPGSSAEDVPRRVVVPISGVAAVEAVVHAISQRFGYGGQGSALTARLRRVPGINGNQRHTSFFRFVSEDAEELAPSHVVGALRQWGTDNALDVQLLVADDAVLADQGQRGFVLKVSALIGDVQMQPLHLLDSLPPSRIYYR